MKPRIERSTCYHRGGNKTYQLHIYTQPRLDWYMYRAYHWYDMRIPLRIPGWKRLRDWLHTHYGAQPLLGFDGELQDARWYDKLYGWDIEQDFRCYHLSMKNRTSLGTAEVSEDVFKSYGRRSRFA